MQEEDEDELNDFSTQLSFRLSHGQTETHAGASSGENAGGASSSKASSVVLQLDDAMPSLTAVAGTGWRCAASWFGLRSGQACVIK